MHPREIADVPCHELVQRDRAAQLDRHQRHALLDHGGRARDQARAGDRHPVDQRQAQIVVRQQPDRINGQLVAARLGRSHATVARRGFVAQVLRRHYQGKPCFALQIAALDIVARPQRQEHAPGGRHAQLALLLGQVLVEVVGIAFKGAVVVPQQVGIPGASVAQHVQDSVFDSADHAAPPIASRA